MVTPVLPHWSYHSLALKAIDIGSFMLIMEKCTHEVWDASWLSLEQLPCHTLPEYLTEIKGYQDSSSSNGY